MGAQVMKSSTVMFSSVWRKSDRISANDRAEANRRWETRGGAGEVEEASLRGREGGERDGQWAVVGEGPTKKRGMRLFK